MIFWYDIFFTDVWTIFMNPLILEILNQIWYDPIVADIMTRLADIAGMGIMWACAQRPQMHRDILRKFALSTWCR